MRKLDLIGQRFGRLIAIKQVEDWFWDRKRYTQWLCQCDCGNKCVVKTCHLRSDTTQSCGCLQKEKASQASLGHNSTHFKHGNSDTRIYHIWEGMKSRCYYTNNIGYIRYGGKGISVCDTWCNDFREFRDWALINGYSDDLTIDRVDSNGNYCPENCRWITKSENSKGNWGRQSLVTELFKHSKAEK